MIDWTDEELAKQMRDYGLRPNYESMLAEFNRRSQVRFAQASETLGGKSLEAAKALVRLTAALAAATALLAFGTLLLAGITVAEWSEDNLVRVIIVVLFTVAGAVALRTIAVAGKSAA